MTPHPVLLAAAALCRLLVDENEALEALDLPRANALLESKRIATDALVAAQHGATLPAGAEAEACTQRLAELAARNKLLLERAIAAQHRVIACIARAIPRAAGQASRYGAGGQTQIPRGSPPIALLSQV